ncbi:hypothetical protein LIER_17899 [Lithospermum erythrorhizon]|uniref:Uncharacterized protein n=1 Tax=Lithospermum erythrorhizon TaxID=34254 RepID=A0AAV3QET2_LITER
MLRVDPSMTVHQLYVGPHYKLIKQKKRTFSKDKGEAIWEEVNQLLGENAIIEMLFATWLADQEDVHGLHEHQQCLSQRYLPTTQYRPVGRLQCKCFNKRGRKDPEACLLCQSNHERRKNTVPNDKEIGIYFDSGSKEAETLLRRAPNIGSNRSTIDADLGESE